MSLEHWKLDSLIATGGMGEVWLARHNTLGIYGAIKLLSKEVADNEKAVARFMFEARVAAGLRHKNIVHVESFGRAPDGRPYIVMELLAGETLDKRLKRTVTFSVQTAHDVLRQSCSALRVAHGAGIVHRDIKPANLFLAEENDREVVKLTDFGLARFVGGAGVRFTGRHRTVGTPKFMSPEQVRGRDDIDHRADLWSLGVIAYKMLTGVHPFPADGAYHEVMMHVVRTEIPPPSKHNQRLPPELDAWMARALQREPGERFQSADEFIAAFERAAGAEIHGGEVSASDPLARNTPVEAPGPGSTNALSDALPARRAALAADDTLPLAPIRVDVPSFSLPPAPPEPAAAKSPAASPATAKPAPAPATSPSSAPPGTAPDAPAEPAEASPSGAPSSSAVVPIRRRQNSVRTRRSRDRFWIVAILAAAVILLLAWVVKRHGG